MNELCDDLQWCIYKLYMKHHIIPYIKENAEEFNTKIYFKTKVLSELLTHSVGNYIGKIINKYIDENESIVDYVYWDNIYYHLMDIHVDKSIDLFLFTNLKDVITKIDRLQLI